MKDLIRSFSYNDEVIVMLVESYLDNKLIKDYDISIRLKQPEYFKFSYVIHNILGKRIIINIELTEDGKSKLGLFGYPSEFIFTRDEFLNFIISGKSSPNGKIKLLLDPLSVKMKNYFIEEQGD